MKQNVMAVTSHYHTTQHTPVTSHHHTTQHKDT
jgi:hypothetical protein